MMVFYWFLLNLVQCSIDRGLHIFAKDTADEIVELEQDGIARIYIVNFR